MREDSLEAQWQQCPGSLVVLLRAAVAAPQFSIVRALHWSSRLRAVGLGSACPLVAIGADTSRPHLARLQACAAALGTFRDERAVALARALVSELSSVDRDEAFACVQRLCAPLALQLTDLPLTRPAVTPRHLEASIIIPVFNKAEYTATCLATLATSTPPDRYEVVVVDNGSTDWTGELLSELSGNVTVIRNPKNRGFAAACNQGARAAQGRHLLFLNNDTEALPNWFDPLVSALDEDETVAVVGARLLYPNGTIQHAGVMLLSQVMHGGELGGVHRFAQMHPSYLPSQVRTDLTVVTGAVMAVRRRVFEDIGGFCEEYWNGYEDMDLCLAVRHKGYRVVYEPASVLIHHESVSGFERHRCDDSNYKLFNSRWDGVDADVEA